MQCVYMQVTQDKYELPVAVADSIAELSKMTGKSATTISSTMYYDRKNGRQCKYVKVNIEEGIT